MCEFTGVTSNIDFKICSTAVKQNTRIILIFLLGTYIWSILQNLLSAAENTRSVVLWVKCFADVLWVLFVLWHHLILMVLCLFFLDDRLMTETKYLKYLLLLCWFFWLNVSFLSYNNTVYLGSVQLFRSIISIGWMIHLIREIEPLYLLISFDLKSLSSNVNVVTTC